MFCPFAVGNDGLDRWFKHLQEQRRNENIWNDVKKAPGIIIVSVFRYVPSIHPFIHASALPYACPWPSVRPSIGLDDDPFSLSPAWDPVVIVSPVPCFLLRMIIFDDADPGRAKEGVEARSGLKKAGGDKQAERCETERPLGLNSTERTGGLLRASRLLPSSAVGADKRRRGERPSVHRSVVVHRRPSSSIVVHRRPSSPPLWRLPR
jgi:hypothetical protein